MSLDMTTGYKTPPKTASFSFCGSQLSSFISIDENTMEDCHNKHFQADTLLVSSQDKQNRSVPVARIWQSLLEV
eukprot:3124735-Ditylum_brightwellii.AAC.1